MRGPLRVLFYVGPPLAWMILIFSMSTRAGGTGISTSLIERLLARISPEFLRTLSDYQIYCLDYAVRKTGHVAEYAILTLLAVRAFQYGRPVLRARALFGGFALSVLYAISDEFHQSFVPGRTPSYHDVLIDSVGALISAASILLLFGLKAVERRLWRSAAIESESEPENTPVAMQGESRTG